MKDKLIRLSDVEKIFERHNEKLVEFSEINCTDEHDNTILEILEIERDIHSLPPVETIDSLLEEMPKVHSKYKSLFLSLFWNGEKW